MSKDKLKVTDWREGRRLRAWGLKQQGWSQSAITPAGDLYLAIKERTLKGADVVHFLQQSLDHLPSKLLRVKFTRVVWDGIGTRRSRAVKDLLAIGAGQRLWIEPLPGYAPELTRDEGIWSYLKRVELRNLVCHNLDHLRSELEKAVERLNQKPEIVRGCIKEPGCYTV